ncbi:hypothetical protein F5Y14DRAFT_426368 [Nemania sp. NC0429]|nr:hypothetical protein F5Y14DRAFT_426368 [Nemania sp. NC0429]
MRFILFVCLSVCSSVRPSVSVSLFNYLTCITSFHFIVSREEVSAIFDLEYALDKRSTLVLILDNLVNWFLLR